MSDREKDWYLVTEEQETQTAKLTSRESLRDEIQMLRLNVQILLEAVEKLSEKYEDI